MKLATYVLVSTALATATLVRALAVYPNYFSAMLSLSNGIITLVIVCNMGVVMMILFGLLIIKVFLSQIRSNEVEDLWYRFSLLVCDTVMFWGKGTYSWLDAAPTAFLLQLLFALHWITGDRLKIAFYEHSRDAILKLARLGALVLILAYVDYKMLANITHEIFGGYSRLSDLAMLAPLVVDLAELSLGAVLRFTLNSVEAWILAHADEDDDADEWDHKQKCGLFINAFVDFSGALGHAVLMNPIELLSIHTYKVGIRIYRVGMTIKKIHALMKAQASLEKLARPATEAELERDNLCLICREEMTATGHKSARRVPRRLNCGHIIHFNCLRSWMGRSDLCPTCRQSVHKADSAFAARLPNAAPAAPDPAPRGEQQAQQEQIPRERRVFSDRELQAIRDATLRAEQRHPYAATRQIERDIQMARARREQRANPPHPPAVDVEPTPVVPSRNSSLRGPLTAGVKVSTEEVAHSTAFPWTKGTPGYDRRAMLIDGTLYEFRQARRSNSF